MTQCVLFKSVTLISFLFIFAVLVYILHLRDLSLMVGPNLSITAKYENNMYPLDLGLGNPHIFEKYWRPVNIRSAASKTIPYNLNGLRELNYLTLSLHQDIFKNICMEKYEQDLVFGLGSTQLISAWIYSVLRRTEERPLYAWTGTPGYSLFRDATQLFSPNIEWVDDIEEFEAIPYDKRMIFISNPNNPDGAVIENRRIPSAKYICNDSVYDIPQLFYLPEDEPDHSEKGEVNLFSFSKYLGFAGSRCGYAFIRKCKKSKQIIRYMREFVNTNTLGICTDGQVKCIQGSKYLLQYPSILRTIGDEIRSRFFKVEKVLAQYSRKNIAIKNKKPYRVPYLWLKVNGFGDAAKTFLEKYEIIGRPGKDFLVSNKYIRFNLMVDDNVFQEFLQKLHFLEF